MLKSIIFLLVVASTMAYQFRSELDDHWGNYKKKFMKKYVMEENKRRGTWEENIDRIMKHNLEANEGKHSFRLKINSITDQALDEVKSARNGYKHNQRNLLSSSNRFVPPSNTTTIPKAIDWRKKGLVTPVKNQEQCGSCWAFSTTGSVEGQYKKKTGKLVSLSEQNLVDCSSNQGNNGCDGGLMDNAFNYIKINKGIDTEDSYPYTALEGTCKFKKCKVGATVTGYVDIPSGDEEALKQAVGTVGPVSAAIDAGHFSFQHYGSGVYDESECSSSELDHGILIVGYGTEDGQDYWLIKNSWGPDWGIDGYIKISRNNNNKCGVATSASYPLV